MDTSNLKLVRLVHVYQKNEKSTVMPFPVKSLKYGACMNERFYKYSNLC